MDSGLYLNDKTKASTTRPGGGPGGVADENTNKTK